MLALYLYYNTPQYYLCQIAKLRIIYVTSPGPLGFSFVGGGTIQCPAGLKKGEGTLYLSVIRGLFDGSIVVYRTSTLQNCKLVFDGFPYSSANSFLVAPALCHASLSSNIM